MRYRPLRHNSEFGRVYARGKAYVDHALVLYVLKTRAKQTRVGLTATKKVGCAVRRNRARRVMKAAIDEHLDYNIGGYNLIFVARAATPGLKSWQVSRAVARLFRQAGLPDKALAPGAPPPASRPRAGARKPGRPRRKGRPAPREPAAETLPGRAVRPHPAVQAVHQPGPWAQLPLYPHLQRIRHPGHPDPRLPQGPAAGRLEDRPLQPLGRWGYDPVPAPGRWTNPRRVLHPPRARPKR